jgi:hypothetical protein
LLKNKFKITLSKNKLNSIVCTYSYCNYVSILLRESSWFNI